MTDIGSMTGRRSKVSRGKFYGAWPVVTMIALVVVSCNMGKPAATAQDCRAILNRIVEIELAELGYRDPVLRAKKQSELAARYERELAACVGRPLATDALQCVEAATSTEQIAHDCLAR